MNLQLGTGQKIEVAIGNSGPEIALHDKKGLKMPQNGPKIECWAGPIQLTQKLLKHLMMPDTPAHFKPKGTT